MFFCIYKKRPMTLELLVININMLFRAVVFRVVLRVGGCRGKGASSKCRRSHTGKRADLSLGV